MNPLCEGLFRPASRETENKPYKLCKNDSDETFESMNLRQYQSIPPRLFEKPGKFYSLSSFGYIKI